MWTAHAPSVPGAYGLGATPAEAKRDLTCALELLSDYLAEVGEDLPSARKVKMGQVRI